MSIINSSDPKTNDQISIFLFKDVKMRLKSINSSNKKTNDQISIFLFKDVLSYNYFPKFLKFWTLLLISFCLGLFGLLNSVFVLLQIGIV